MAAGDEVMVALEEPETFLSAQYSGRIAETYRLAKYIDVLRVDSCKLIVVEPRFIEYEVYDNRAVSYAAVFVFHPTLT